MTRIALPPECREAKEPQASPICPISQPPNTPPYGLVLLMASKFVGVPFSKALRAALPIYVVFLVTITFTIYFPKVVLWLPKQVIPESVGCFKSPSGTGYICPN